MRNLQAQHVAATFFIRYDQIQHYQRHEQLEHLVTPCCFCRDPRPRSWQHVLLECEGSYFKTRLAEKKTLEETQHSTRELFEASKEKCGVEDFNEFRRFITSSDISHLRKERDLLARWCSAIHGLVRLQIKFTAIRFSERVESARKSIPEGRRERKKERNVEVLEQLLKSKSSVEFDRILEFYEVKSLPYLWTTYGSALGSDAVSPLKLRTALGKMEEDRGWICNTDAIEREEVPLLGKQKRQTTRLRLKSWWKSCKTEEAEDLIQHSILDNLIEVYLAHVREYGLAGAYQLLEKWWEENRGETEERSWERRLEEGISYACRQGILFQTSSVGSEECRRLLKEDWRFCNGCKLLSEIEKDRMSEAGKPWTPRVECLKRTQATMLFI